MPCASSWGSRGATPELAWRLRLDDKEKPDRSSIHIIRPGFSGSKQRSQHSKNLRAGPTRPVAGRALEFRSTGQESDLTLVPLNRILDERHAVYFTEVQGGLQVSRRRRSRALLFDEAITTRLAVSSMLVLGGTALAVQRSLALRAT